MFYYPTLCFANWNLKRTQETKIWHKQGAEIVILNCRFNVKSKNKFNTFQFSFDTPFLSIYKSGDQQNWANSENISNSPSYRLLPPSMIRVQHKWYTEKNASLGCLFSFSTPFLHPWSYRTLHSSNSMSTIVPQQR